MKHLLRLLGLLFAATLVSGAMSGPLYAKTAPSEIRTDHVQAQLLAHAPDGVAPGQTVWVGLRLVHQPQWHTYWKNPGDSGLPTELAWTLPAGVVAGDIAWPVPQKIRVGPLVNYGYEGNLLLAVPLTITPAFKPSLLQSHLDVQLKASWLVCKTECIPEAGELALQLPLRGSTAIDGAAFEAAWQAQSQPLAARAEARIEQGQLVLRVPGLPASWQGQALTLFPEVGEVIEAAAEGQQAWDATTWTARVPLSAHRRSSPAEMAWLVARGAEGRQVQAVVQGPWPAVAPAAGVPAALQAALDANTPAPPRITWWAALLGALLGGLILNLMPCVFPILAIKITGLAQQAEKSRAQAVAAGWSYTAGVVLAFVGLAGVMLALRAAGQQLGWGFQLQAPPVVVALALLFTLLGLNLAGVFEVRSLLPSRWAAQQAQHPLVQAFLSGLLAVAVASPCTAPFMGAALGFAVSLPAAAALMVFAVLGLGMALPYLAVCLVPTLARRLPRPGAWMESFRRLMAFPMFGTVVWLLWVLGQQIGGDGAAAVLGLLVGVALLAWTCTLQGRARRWLIGLACVVVAVLLRLAVPLLGHTPVPAVVAASAWQPWSAQRVTELVGQGRTVFVDFTAAWCITCQYNKRTTLAHAPLLAQLQAQQVALLRADWTRRDPAITAALAQLGRSGVPVYVFYAPNQPPRVLSEVLSVDEVQQALAQLQLRTR